VFESHGVDVKKKQRICILLSKLVHMWKNYGEVVGFQKLRILNVHEYVDIMEQLNMTIYHANESLKVALQTSETITCIRHGLHLHPYLRSDTELVEGGSAPKTTQGTHDCGSLVEILESDGVDENGDEGYTKTPHNYDLQEMHLYDLPKLMHIWKNHGGILGCMKP
ncbi:hypothetical protein CR513_09444, partial [Mucuna pruriens]